MSRGQKAVQAESAKTDWRVRWRLFSSEVIGTAALVFGGLSVVRREWYMAR